MHPRNDGGEGCHRILVGDVELQSGAADLVGKLFEPVDATGTDDDVVALLGKLASGGLADARAGSGDDGYAGVGGDLF